jgi:hypothetical protein
MPQDHKLPGDKRREYRDITGAARGERISEYFDFERWPEKKTKTVTRLELLAILTREYKIKQASTWWNRVKLFLARAPGSKPAVLDAPEQEAS